MQLEHVTCDLCGDPNYRVIYRKPDNWLRLNQFEFPVVECKTCGLVYVNPRPTIESMADFYPADYHSGRSTAEHTRRYKIQHSLLPDVTGMKVLDIGCAQGDFLTHLLDIDEGFHAYGIDAFSRGPQDPRITFTRATFCNTTYPSGYFDLVMSWAVFEHIHQPSGYFSEAARVLKPGGKLIILVTNAKSLYGRAAYLEDLPRHTYHYSPTTLAGYAKKAGLRLTQIEFNDDIFDGRGTGTFMMLAGKLTGFTWEKLMHNELGLHHRIAMKLGKILDRIFFATHWEAKLGKSGIMIATYEKP